MDSTAGTTKVQFMGQWPCAPDIVTFRFTRPEGYRFEAGQFFLLTLDTREGRQTKAFSHASAPEDPAIDLTTRLTGSAFKDALLGLRAGAELTIAGPRGHLGPPPSADNVAFLTGGVGITPAHSIIRHLALSGSDTGIALFFGNRTDECVPYGEEFRELAAHRPGFMLAEIIEQPTPAWTGPTGRIDEAFVRRFVTDPHRYFWVVSGPPPMVEAMRPVVSALGLERDEVAFESFSGYQK